MFRFKDGSPLTRDKFSNLVNQTVKNAGWQGNFTTHSFRVGAASDSSVQDLMIRAREGGTVMRIVHLLNLSINF